ncbi:hypothetical protein FJ963_03505 [Mesorhizobium sp. B2-1-4]|nr:hypothetical protein FJ551_09185 [Mesorhizobium sp. B2-5-1]TPM60644.1 hypothetical protein FJ962_16040 [Mesorhizobium sp. B2-1-9]TPM88025.1 hypothetical protein FJ963_03505 [Mesorhizobium sp. B2-1-4]TPN11055.1 hypothetical protein FJ971_13205 [Mesorhizobium sp. B2-1-2]
MLYPGRFLEPSDIEMLARVCHAICKERGVPLGSHNGELIAAHVLRLFMNGLTGASELLDAERNWATRPAAHNQISGNNYANMREAA